MDVDDMDVYYGWMDVTDGWMLYVDLYYRWMGVIGGCLLWMDGYWGCTSILHSVQFFHHALLLCFLGAELLGGQR